MNKDWIGHPIDASSFGPGSRTYEVPLPPIRSVFDWRHVIALAVQKADWVDKPGREAGLKVGPFRFGVNTADDPQAAFGLVIGRWSWEWTLGAAQDWEWVQ